MNTISKEKVFELWDGKVKIFYINSFDDNRGLVSEVYRSDDETTIDVKQCYISETNPFVLRGPHQHPGVEWIDNGKGQCDNFITWKSRVCYELYNPDTEEFRYFITSKDKIMLTQVDTPIIHAYRNLENKKIQTMNFPTQLFMGEGKGKKADEVRYESIQNKSQSTYIVLGAAGRLGNAIVRNLYLNIGMYDYSVIPVYDYLNSSDDIKDILQNMNKQIDGGSVHVINCMASTDVANSSGRDSWNNFTLPCFLFDHCSKLNYKFYHISTDYVYQDMNLASPYSNQKKKAEDSLLQRGNQDLLKILRVANLVDTSDDRPNNIVKKLWAKVQEGGAVHYDPSYRIYPSDVDVLAKHIVETAFTTDAKIINYVSPPYTIDDFVRKFFQYENLQEANYPIPSWHDKYETDEECDIIKVPSSESQIRDYVSKLIEGV
jgi:dTDP-4-dehydrorhamnose reductase/dTDP-4-dehydrorhamnose 3,5-epimerase-like enzyme